MCVLSIKVPIRKKSGNLLNDPRIKYIYISRNRVIVQKDYLENSRVYDPLISPIAEHFFKVCHDNFYDFNCRYLLLIKKCFLLS